MGLGGKKRIVTPHEQNTSPSPKKSPKIRERKMKRKKKKRDMEELKEEVVLVRTPITGPDESSSADISQPSAL